MVHDPLDEPAVRTGPGRAVVALRAPGVVVVHHAVLLAPPVERRHEEDQAEHPPGERHLHSVVLLQVLHGVRAALRATLLQPVPEDELHHLTILWPVEARASQDPVFRNWLASCVGDWTQGVAELLWDGLPTAEVLLVT